MVKEVVALAEYNGIKNSGKVLVDYYATWCGPCKMIAPKLEEFEQQFTGVTFIKVDVDKASEVAEAEQISAMPTFKLFKDGQLVETVVGASEANILAALQKLNA